MCSTVLGVYMSLMGLQASGYGYRMCGKCVCGNSERKRVKYIL